jgi:hypothetical protein
MLLFQPALWRPPTLFDLPRPVTRLRIQDAWDIERFKVPLIDGDTLLGHSRNGVDVSLEGQIGSRDGSLLLDEPSMLAALEDLRATLDVNGDDDLYELVLYRDPDTDEVRSLRRCSTVRFEYDLSDKQLFTYSIVIHASDPVIYTELE